MIDNLDSLPLFSEDTISGEGEIEDDEAHANSSLSNFEPKDGGIESPLPPSQTPDEVANPIREYTLNVPPVPPDHLYRVEETPTANSPAQP